MYWSERLLKYREKFIAVAKRPSTAKKEGVISLPEVEKLIFLLKESARISAEINLAVRQAGNKSNEGGDIKIPIQDGSGRIVHARLTNPSSVFVGVGEAAKEIEAALKHAEDGVLEVLLNSYDNSIESERR